MNETIDITELQEFNELFTYSDETLNDTELTSLYDTKAEQSAIMDMIENGIDIV